MHSLSRLSCTAAALAIAVAATPAFVAGQTSGSHQELVGVWTLNDDLSTKPPAAGEPGRGRGERGPGRGGFGGGRRGGGFGRGGGGFGRGGGGFGRGGAGGGDYERPDGNTGQRQREAVRAVMEAPRRITVTMAESMVIITTDEGLTTRLSTDGKKVKDESSGIERRTHWDGNRLVTELSGAGPRKLLETYSVDPETHRLTVTVAPQGGRDDRPSITRVYDAEPR